MRNFYQENTEKLFSIYIYKDANEKTCAEPFRENFRENFRETIKEASL